MPALTFDLPTATGTGSVPPGTVAGHGVANTLTVDLSAAYFGFDLPLPLQVSCVPRLLAWSIGTPATAGDFFSAPVVLTGTSGSSTINLSAATIETGEDTTLAPDVFSTVGSRSLWLEYTATAAGIFSFEVNDNTTTGYRLAFIQGDSIDDPALVLVAESDADGVNDPVLTVSLSRGETLRIYIATITGSSGTYPSSLAYTWSHDTSAVFTTVMTVEPKQYDRSPVSVNVSVINMDPSEDVDFQVLGHGGVLATITADTDGTILGVSVPLNLALDAGTYIMEAVGQSSGNTVTDTFTLLNDPLSRPTAVPTDTAVSPPVQVGVQRWVFQDGLPGGLGTLIFTTNPKTASSPFAEKTVTVQHTVAQDGTTMIWEASPPAHPMQFSGFTDDAAFIASMNDFLAIGRRFYWIDHRERVWVVALTAFGEDRRRKNPEVSADFPWAMNYTGTLMIFAGPM